MSTMLKLLKEVKAQYAIEFESLNKDDNAVIITTFFQFEEQLDKMLYLYNRLEEIRNKKV